MFSYIHDGVVLDNNAVILYICVRYGVGLVRHLLFSAFIEAVLNDTAHARRLPQSLLRVCGLLFW